MAPRPRVSHSSYEQDGEVVGSSTTSVDRPSLVPPAKVEMASVPTLSRETSFYGRRRPQTLCNQDASSFRRLRKVPSPARRSRKALHCQSAEPTNKQLGADTPPQDSKEKLNQQDRHAAPELPQTWYYSSNHILVNRERVGRGIPPLKRSVELDGLARQLADWIAQGNNISELSLPNCLHCNLLRGESIRHIHKLTMTTGACPDERKNVLNPVFRAFGMGTCKGHRDGRLYLCQLFEARRFEI